MHLSTEMASVAVRFSQLLNVWTNSEFRLVLIIIICYSCSVEIRWFRITQNCIVSDLVELNKLTIEYKACLYILCWKYKNTFNQYTRNIKKKNTSFQIHEIILLSVHFNSRWLILRYKGSMKHNPISTCFFFLSFLRKFKFVLYFSIQIIGISYRFK